MSDWIYEYRDRRDGVTIPTIWVAIALSLLLHAAVMWHWLPRLQIPSLAKPASDTLVVRLSPPPGPPAAMPSPPSRPSPAASPARPSHKPKAQRRNAARALPAPQVIALNQPAANMPSAPPAAPAVTAPPPARPASGGDLTSYIEARRLARGDPAPPAPPADDEKSRSNRIAAANLAQQQLAFGYDPSKSGGIFEIKRMGYYNAEFMFYGWNKEIRHNTAQLIEVNKGGDSDIRLAVVRKMIAIIRQHEQGDFQWSSPRLGRDITLSARARDNAGLEDFMMQEFFYDPRPSR